MSVIMVLHNRLHTANRRCGASMLPNKADALWQKLVEEEKQRLASLPAEELREMGFYTTSEIRYGKTSIPCEIWHEEPGHRIGILNHSFIVCATRKLVFGLHRKYLAGFALDGHGNVVPLHDKVLPFYK